MLGRKPEASELKKLHSLPEVLLLHVQLRPPRSSSTSRARRWRAPSGGPSRRPLVRTGPLRPPSRHKGEHLPHHGEDTTLLSFPESSIWTGVCAGHISMRA